MDTNKALAQSRLVLWAIFTLLTILLGCGSGEGAGGVVEDGDQEPLSPTLSFDADPVSIHAGESALLSWTSANTYTCEASGGWDGVKDTSGSESTGPLDSDTEFSLDCTGDGGTVSSSITIKIIPAPTLTFLASPSIVDPGGSSTLTWSSTNADSCTASDAWSGDKGTSGSQSTGPLDADALYQLTCTGPGGEEVTRSVKVSVNSQSTGDSIVSFVLEDTGSGAGRPVSFGLPLAEGVLANGEEVVVTKPDGTVVPSQWSPLAYWRTDGSQLHGVLAFLTPDAGDNSGAYLVKHGTSAVGTEIGRSDLVAAGFDAVVEVDLGGSVYSLSAKKLLDGTVQPRQDRVHFAGPMAAEFVVGGPLLLDGTGAEHRTLQAYFYLRAFQRPVDRVFVTVVLENTGAFNELSDIVTNSVDIEVGSTSIEGFPKTGLTVYADTRLQKRVWWNGDPGVWVKQDVEYVQDTKLVPEYRDVSLDDSWLASLPQATDWNERNILSTTTLESGGAKPELAPYDRWTAAYLVSGDRRAWNAMRAAQDEYAFMVYKSSSGLFRARDEGTGLPIDLGTYGVISDVWGTLGNSTTLSANRDGVASTQTDLAHYPSVGYVTYLLTGESNELENLQFSGIAAWLNERPGGYAGVIPGRQWGARGQVRAIAWGFREILNAGTLTPDDHPLHDTLVAAVGNALDELNIRGRPLDREGNTGLWLTGPGIGVAIIYSADATPNPDDVGGGGNDGVGVAMWQDDWLTWSVGSAYERGWRGELEASGFWLWKAQAVVSRFGTGGAGFCWEYAPGYALGVQDTSSGPVYENWGRIFAENWPTVTTCGQEGGPFLRSDGSSTTYGAQIGPALALAVSTGIPGAATAWDLYDGRSTSWSFSRSPEWAMEPR